jgi:uncharacterized membrane protein HdeD (DUF308 family)
VSKKKETAKNIARFGQGQRCEKTMGHRKARFALWVGSTLTLLAIGGVSTVTFPYLAIYYYTAVIGLSLIVAGLLSYCP